MLKKILIITKYTFKEIFKSNIFYITLAVGVAMMVMTYVATEFTYGVPEKVALDFGLGMLSLSSMAISLFMGVGLLAKEIDSRTVYMVISRPVPRWVFITGKILGLLCVLLVNLLILALMTIGSSALLGGDFGSMAYVAVGFNFLESILLLLVVVFFSLFLNSILSTVISFLLLISGYAINEAKGTMFVEGRKGLKTLLELYDLVLPAFYKLNFRDFVVYQQGVDRSYILQSLSYGLLYCGFLYVMIIYIFNRKNLD